MLESESVRENHLCRRVNLYGRVSCAGASRVRANHLAFGRRSQELSYNYKFEREKDKCKKIRCNCGARTCTGWMN